MLKLAVSGPIFVTPAIEACARTNVIHALQWKWINVADAIETLKLKKSGSEERFIQVGIVSVRSDISRFSRGTITHRACSCGLCGAEKSSAQKVMRTPVSEQHIQPGLVEAAKLAPRQDHDPVLVYEREKEKRNANRTRFVNVTALVSTIVRNPGSVPFLTEKSFSLKPIALGKWGPHRGPTHVNALQPH